jgi:DNA/RNA-binding domain of Phe-tRNA-synthetase-like protein
VFGNASAGADCGCQNHVGHHAFSSENKKSLKQLIKIDSCISSKCPNLRLGIVTAKVCIEIKNERLWHETDLLCEQKKQLSLDQVKQIPEIASSREAYKALGKEPSRYRLSAEALHRRVIRGMDLYRINNVVDCINYVSLKSSFSIGGYDLAKIQGEIRLDLGCSEDVYEAIGRGKMNIENLPVFRDDIGAFGSPTSDSTRTMITESTQNILLVFLDFGGHESLQASLELMRNYLNDFASAKDTTSNC